MYAIHTKGGRMATKKSKSANKAQKGDASKEKTVPKTKAMSEDKEIKDTKELDDLIDISHYEVDTDKSWQRIRHNSRSVSFLNALKVLASWREKRAIKHNTSRQNIIKDDMLINIATAFPKTLDELKQVRGMRSDLIRSVLATEIIEQLNKLEQDGFDKNITKINNLEDRKLKDI